MALAPKQRREQRRHYIDARIDATTGTPVFYRLGNDNEDLARSIGWDTSTVKVVTGVTATTSTRSDETLTTDPFYAREGDPMALLLQHFDETSAELDEIKRFYYEAKIDNDGETIYAFKQMADIKLTSTGGAATDGDNLPFEMSLSGAKIPQDFDLATEEFTDKAVTP